MPLYNKILSAEWNLDEEYDPMVPNSYEVVKAEHLKSEKRRLANLMSSASKKLSVPCLLDVIDKLDDEEEASKSSSDKKSRGTAIAPPPSLSSSSNNIPLAELPKDSTRILLLQNMVGPGEVDADLEYETKEECKKYGDVVKCLIYEIPNKRVPDDEAVRIFVEFRHADSASKAASDLNGRYFGGRVVRTSFYSVEKFNKYELAP